MNCHKYKLYFIDYIDGTLPVNRHIEIRNHLRECKECRDEVKELKETINFIQKESENYIAPDNLLDDIKTNIGAHKTRKKHRKRIKTPMGIALIVVLLVTIAFASEGLKEIIHIGNIEGGTQTITLNENMDKEHLNELDISVIDQDIKITITGILADDMQIQVFYEIEDLDGNTKYSPDEESIQVKGSILSRIDLYSTDKALQKGSVLIIPSRIEEKLDLSFTKLKDPKYGSKTIEGIWNFAIPVKRYEPKEYYFGESLEINGDTIVIEKLTLLPTATILDYKYFVDDEEKFASFNSVKLITDNSIYRSSFEHSKLGQSILKGWNYDKIIFDSIYFADIENIEIRFVQYSRYTENQRTYELDLDDEESQEIEYMGSKIVIGNFEERENITLKMIETLRAREYQILDLRFVNSKGETISREDEIEGYFLAKHSNNLYTYEQGLQRWGNIRNLKFYSTSHNITLYQNIDGQDIMPRELIIEGYYKTYDIDKVVEFELDNPNENN